jgi:hypothetical protein
MLAKSGEVLIGEAEELDEKERGRKVVFHRAWQE